MDMNEPLPAVVSFVERSRADFVADLAALVNRDCGTFNKAGVDAAGHWIAGRCQEWQWQVERLPLAQYGDCWLARLEGDGQGRLMLMGHLDTVYPDGTAAARPMRIEGTRIFGPGTCDMKAGLLVGLYATRALQLAGFRDYGELLFFFNSDEEVGSPGSRPLYSPVAENADVAFVLEAARANGDIVSARKGAGHYVIRVQGKSAHAGVEPEKGANAILELAHKVVAAQHMNGIAPGVTVNVGTVSGGTRSNVVPDTASAEVDVRATDVRGAETVARAFVELAQHATVPGTAVSVEGTFGCPPMPKTRAAELLVSLAQQCAHGLGFSLRDTATGGVSDANVIAGLGVPVLDGLGPIGGLDHSPNEYIDGDSIVPRTLLLAELIRLVVGERERLRSLRETRQ